MKFKPLCYDYHSEAVHLLSQEFPNKPTTKPLIIHISPELWDQDQNEETYEETIGEQEDGEEEEANEQHESSMVEASFPLMDSTNQAVDTSTNSSIIKPKSSKKSKKSSKQKGESSNKPSRRRRKKRRRDSVDFDSEAAPAKSAPEAPFKDQTSLPIHEQSPITAQKNTLHGDPRNGERRWRRRKISNPELEQHSSFETSHPRLEAKELESMDLDRSSPNETFLHPRLGDPEMELSSVHQGHASTSRNAPSTDPRTRRRKRRLVNAICKSTMGSKGVIVLLPRAFSIYDSPFLVSLWSNIRTCSNRKRVANFAWWSQPSFESYKMEATAAKVAFWRQPSACSQFQSTISYWWRRRAEIAFFRQFSRSLSHTATAKLDHVLSLLASRHLSGRHEEQRPISLKLLKVPEADTNDEKKEKPPKLPYRYCLLDILQGNAGTFREVSVGSPSERHETRKRELQAIVPYVSVPQSSPLEVQQRLEFAILLAMNMARNQVDGNSRHPHQYHQEQESSVGLPRFDSNDHAQSSLHMKRKKDDRNGDEYGDRVARLHSTDYEQSSLPAKRKAVDRNVGLALKKRSQRKLSHAQDEALAAVRSRSHPTTIVNADVRLPPPSTQNPVQTPHVLQPPLRTSVATVPNKGPESIADGAPRLSAPPNQNPTQEVQQPPLRKAPPAANKKKKPAKAKRKRDLGQARKTELSLLERFGLAPNPSEPTENTPKSIPSKKKRPSTPTSSPEEAPQSKRKQQTMEHAAPKSSRVAIAPNTEVKVSEPQRMPRQKENPLHRKPQDNRSEKVAPGPVPTQAPQKAPSVATPQIRQPSSCQPTPEVASGQKETDGRSEYYRNWQPKNFDLDNESALSFNNNDDDDDSDIQVIGVTTPKMSSVREENNDQESSKPPAVSLSDKKKRKRARKAAKKNKDHKHKRKSKKRKKKKSHGELFDQQVPESVLQSLEEDAVEEEPHTPSNIQVTPLRAPDPQANSRLTIQQANEMENGSPDQPIVIDGGSYAEEEGCTELPQQVGRIPLLFLCSENFLESWGDTAARLVSGEWQQRAVPARRFLFVDTNLVDMCGVDIELPNRGGIVVSAMSSWYEDGGFDALMMRIVGLISTTRFRYLSIYLCADVDQDDVMVDRMATLQNAVLHQGDGLVTATTFTLVSPNALPVSIGRFLFNLDAAWGLEEVESWLHDDRTFERLRFLVQLIPTLTATSVLQCLMSTPAANTSFEDKSCFWFQSLFHPNGRERNRLQSMDPKLLHPAVAKQLSFALGVNVSDESVFRSNV